MWSYIIYFIKILVDTLAISSDSEDSAYYECQATGKEPELEVIDYKTSASNHAEQTDRPSEPLSAEDSGESPFKLLS